jgi:hypothetical protein
MIKLDDDLLQELGLAALPAEEKKKLLAHIYETLEMRVGMKLAEQMTDAQLTEFEQFIDRNDEAGALRWLEANFPNYKDVVASEFERLKSEIGQVAPQILSAGTGQPAAPAPQAPAQPQPPQAPSWPPNNPYPPAAGPAPTGPAPNQPWPPQPGAPNAPNTPPYGPPAHDQGNKSDYDLAA